ncbi:MAG TPA: Gfo/Idh/MocA family oxidoreductase [Gammaproteobacteria bacterium]|nr:Gfo/Idh/MocA family oxidoreductase [Gammaproteobacteria bacterium]
MPEHPDDTSQCIPTAPLGHRPRLGFLGTGWIGRDRMLAIARSGVAEIVAVADPSAPARAAAREALAGLGVRDVHCAATLPELLASEPDGVIIATPSGMHAQETLTALAAGASVFCQKPLGRDLAEVRAAIATARQHDRLLAVDMSYRRTSAVEAVRAHLASGALGRIYAAELTFHNAYGPDKPWFYRRSEGGGGCLMDLGCHLVDLLCWLLPARTAEVVTARCLHRGRPLAEAPEDAVEDYATAQLSLPGGIQARLACSWHLPAGQDAVIGLAIYGTEGGVALHNIAGSFYDFEAVALEGTGRRQLAAPPDDWGGRQAIAFARQLAGGHAFDPEVERLAGVAAILDAIYAHAGISRSLARAAA